MARGRPSKKQQILDTAQRLFCDFGYQGTTIDLVVQAAGVSKPTVYGHFPSKQLLWQAVLEQAIERAERQREGLTTVGGDWLELVLSAFGQFAARPELIAIHRIMLGEQHKMNAGARQCFAEFEQRLEKWCDWVMAGQEVRLDADQRFLLLGLCREGVLQPALHQRDPLDPDRLKTIIERALGV